MDIAPIIIFCYNRPSHLQQAVEALQANVLADKSELFIYSDGAKGAQDQQQVAEVRAYINSIVGFKNIAIIERKTNWGLAKSVIQGVTEISEKFGKVIVLEDDLVTSPNFLNYMNECLNFYEKDPSIFSISGFAPPIQFPKNYNKMQYLVPRPCSWGWGTWKNRWELVDWNVSDFDLLIQDKSRRKEFNASGKDSTAMLLKQVSNKIDSWAIRWHYSCFKLNKFCVYPRRSFVKNIGTDGSGTHFKQNQKFNVDLSTNQIQPENIHVFANVVENFQKLYNPSIIRKAINLLLMLVYIYKNNR